MYLNWCIETGALRLVYLSTGGWAAGVSEGELAKLILGVELVGGGGGGDC